MASVTFEKFIENHNIEIPSIQRDYVQGRGVTIEEKDKREAFVAKLISALRAESKKKCHLEFVYGAVNDTSHAFIPLDGQQRLTTLFILHWVIWQKSSKEMQNKFQLETISGFKYETRISSRNFCKCIVSKELLPIREAKTLGQQLQGQPWFSEDWLFDPTIKAMISMIDFIESKLYAFGEPEISSMLIRLCGEDNAISFDELNMADYDLTDSLYIKMNSRGKHLTPFENWKSDFIKYLESGFGNDEYLQADKSRNSQSFSYKDYFCYSIEHEWTDLFWSYLSEEYLNLDENEQKKQYPCIDKMFMNLFDCLCFYRYYKNSETKISYTDIQVSTKRKLWQNKEFIDFLFASLDSLCRIDHNDFFEKLFYISTNELPAENHDNKVRLFRTKNCNLFKLCVENGSSMELIDILLFHSLLYYCNKKTTFEVDNSIKAYIRKVRNYYESDIQNIRTRTTVQLNLRVSEFEKYDDYMRTMINGSTVDISINDSIIDDCSLTHGNNKVFLESIKKYGSDKVVDALKMFCGASQTERIRVLISCGFNGTYLSDCIGRDRYFWGSKDKWDVLFISDNIQLSKCFSEFTSRVINGKSITDIIDEGKTIYTSGFRYYMLNYDAFLNANSSQHHYAVKGDLDDVDWVALGSYSSNPGTAYHTDPFAVAIEQELSKRHPEINLALYKQYSGKCPLSVVKDKKNWESVFSIISRKDGWHVVYGDELLSNAICSELNVSKADGNNEYIILPSENNDMIMTGVNLLESIHMVING